MPLNALGHLWTIGPRLRHAVRPLACPASRPWETTLTDPQVGPVRLTGHLRELPGAAELAILVHGLGGSIGSHYMPRGAAAVERVGLSCLRLNLRGADRLGEDYYHAGLTADLHAALASPELEGYRRLYVIGYSMGGHVTLRLATEPADPRLAAVAAVCAPVDLARAQQEIDAPALWVYRRYLLVNLGSLYAGVAARRPVSFPVERLGEIRTFREWDDRIVAPRFGFADAADYYARASVAPLLGSLRLPALLLNAERDPMVPARSVKPALAGASPELAVRWMRGGGHVFFPGEGIDGQVIAWLRSRRRKDIEDRED
jgi:predicted alpha/beta-fold hydrolase